MRLTAAREELVLAFGRGGDYMVSQAIVRCFAPSRKRLASPGDLHANPRQVASGPSKYTRASRREDAKIASFVD